MMVRYYVQSKALALTLKLVTGDRSGSGDTHSRSSTNDVGAHSVSPLSLRDDRTTRCYPSMLALVPPQMDPGYAAASVCIRCR